MKYPFTSSVQRLLWIAASLGAVVNFTWPASAAQIILKSQAVPRGTVVRLGDVADVRSTDSAEAERLAAMPLMPVPSAGSQRFLRLREVQDLLAAHGENLNQHEFEGEDVVAVAAREGRARAEESTVRALRQIAWSTGGAKSGVAPPELTEAEAEALNQRVRRAVEQHVLQASGQPGTWRVKLEVPRRQLALLTTAASELQCTGGKAPWVGQHRFVISFATQRGGIAQFSVVADVTRPRPVVVAVAPIERGHVLTAADLELTESDHPPTAAAHQTPIDSVESLIGKEATRPLRAGEVIMSNDVRLPILVRRGDEITVIARGGGIQVRTIARAKQDGARGELVQVESLDSREPFDAVVVGPREAVVFAGNPTSTPQVAERPTTIPPR